MESHLVASLQLPAALKDRIQTTVNPTSAADDDDATYSSGNYKEKSASASFVLYLPTVVLRKTHNPAFALACRLANHWQVPLMVLAVVVDDAHLLPHFKSQSDPATRSPIVMTARRLAFVLEALQSAAQEWQQHGAAVLVRLHGPGARTPHHLTLARQAAAVVCDEPFVHPHLRLVQSVEQAVAAAGGIPCFRVDGSTTVPPASVLTKPNAKLPNKAWKWEKMSNARRKAHVYAATGDGQLDAPMLEVTLKAQELLDGNSQHAIAALLPSDWRTPDVPAPGRRPWSTDDLTAIPDLKEWACQWEGADSTVLPCMQTHGSQAQSRWDQFRQHHLSNYAKLRNQVQKPHAVSRMSCFLNYGTISIFQVIHDLWKLPKSTTAKYLDEIVKWREMSYAHAFANPDTYSDEASLPVWAHRCLESCRKQPSFLAADLSLQQLETGSTSDATWNAMQDYLVTTGELHNNARMTWGKTVVYWHKTKLSPDRILYHLCYLNDRYALDGLSPPSYAGILWCLGWCDKPSPQGCISEKVSWRYRVGAGGFQEARRLLLDGHDDDKRNLYGQLTITSRMLRPLKKHKLSPDGGGDAQLVTPPTTSTKAKGSTSKTLLSYFSAQQ